MTEQVANLTAPRSVLPPPRARSVVRGDPAAENAPARDSLSVDPLALTALRRTLRERDLFLSAVEPEPSYGVVFPGLNSHYVDMLAGLRWSDPAVKATFDEADDLFAARHGVTLSSRVYASQGGSSAALAEPAPMQAAIFTAAVAQYRRLLAIAPAPKVVIGHSMGEFAAYVAAGLISFADGFGGILARAEEVTAIPPAERGVLAAVMTPTAEHARLLRRLLLKARAEGVYQAIVNSPLQTIVAGSQEAIARFSQQARERRLATTLLRVSHGFHSPLLAPAQEPLRARFAQLHFQAPTTVAVVSTITGDLIGPDDAADLPDLLAAELTTPFDFPEVLAKVVELGVTNLIDAGPSAIMAKLVDQSGLPLMAVPFDSRSRSAADNLRSVTLSLRSLGVIAPPPAPATAGAVGPATRLATAGGTAPAAATVSAAGGTAPNAAGLAATTLPAARPASPAHPDEADLLRCVSLTTGLPSFMIDPAQPLSRLGLAPAVVEALRQAVRDQWAIEFGDADRSIRQWADDVAAGRVATAVVPVAVAPAATGPSTAVEVRPGVGLPEPVQVSAAELVDLLTQRLAESTGYPLDIIEPDLDLEADLGIDSVKQAEVIGSIVAELGWPDTPLDLAGATTISLLAERLVAISSELGAVPAELEPGLPVMAEAEGLLVKSRPALTALPGALLGGPVVSGLAKSRLAAAPLAWAEPEVPVAPVAALPLWATPVPVAAAEPAVSSALVTLPESALTPAAPLASPLTAEQAAELLTRLDHEQLVEALVRHLVEVTGYPADVVEPDLDLEADLGVDSIKQAEVVVALGQELGWGEMVPDLAGATSANLIADRLLATLAEIAQPTPPEEGDTGDTPDAVAPLVALAAADGPAPLELTGAPDAANRSTAEAGAAAVADPRPELVPPQVARRYILEPLVHPLGDHEQDRFDVTGKTYVVAAGEPAVTAEVRRLLEAAGAVVWVADPRAAATSTDDRVIATTTEPTVIRQRLTEAHAQIGAADGLIYLAALGDHAGALDLPVDEFQAAWQRQLAFLLHLTQEFYDDLKAKGKEALISVLTNSGGCFGLKLTELGDPFGQLVLGGIHSLVRELPGPRKCFVDVNHEARGSAGGLLVREILAVTAARDDQIAYLGDQRHVLRVLPQPLPVSPVVPAARRPGVVVFSGGSRGIALEAAIRWAEVLGDHAVLLGRSSLDNPVSQPYLAMDDEAFAEARLALLQSLHEAHPDWKPVRLREACDHVDHDRQLYGTLERLRQRAVGIDYLTCDVTDPAQVTTTMRLIEEAHGPIRGLVHGAGLVGPALLPKKDLDWCRSLVSVKVDGLYNLVRAVDLDRLDFFCAFNSLSGHFGMDGQFDYSAASALASALTSELAWRHPHLAAVAIDWTAWADAGMALTHTSRHYQENLRGLQYVGAAEGCDHLLREVLAGGHTPQVAVFGGLGYYEPEAVFTCLDTATMTLAGPISEGSVVDQCASPLVDRQLDWTPSPAADARPGEVVFTRHLDPRRDRFLADHMVQGLPTLPGFFHIEAMAEVARLVTGWESVRLESASFLRFVKCRPKATVDLEIRAAATGNGFQATVSADVIGPKGNVLVRRQDRSTGVFRPGPDQAPPAIPGIAAAVLEADRRESFDLDAFYDATENYIAFGPSFRLVEQAWRLEDGRMAGLVRVPNGSRQLLSRGGARFLMEPLLLDCVCRLALIDVLDRSGDHLVPVEVNGLTIFDHPEPGSLVIGLVDYAQSDLDSPTAAVEVLTLDGRPLIRLDSLGVRSVGRDAERPEILVGARSRS